MGSCICFQTSFRIRNRLFIVDKQIGEGGFAYVYLVHEKNNRERKYAIKKILIQNSQTSEAAEKEIQTYQIIKHPNVVQLLDHAYADSSATLGAREAYLLFPYYSGGSLFNMIYNHDPHKPWPFYQEEALRIFKAICEGIKSIHSQRLAHRDIAPGNILFSSSQDAESKSFTDRGTPLLKRNQLNPVIIDLGSAGPLEVIIKTREEALQVQDFAEYNCTMPYRPPELHDVKSNCVIDGRADVWSLGCTLYAMAFGRCPFEDKIQGVLKLYIMSGTVIFPTNNQYMGCQYDTNFCYIIQRMLTADPCIRPTLGEVISWVELLQKGDDLPSHQSNKKMIKSVRSEKVNEISNSEIWADFETFDEIEMCEMKGKSEKLL